MRKKTSDRVVALQLMLLILSVVMVAMIMVVRAEKKKAYEQWLVKYETEQREQNRRDSLYLVAEMRRIDSLLRVSPSSPKSDYSSSTAPSWTEQHVSPSSDMSADNFLLGFDDDVDDVHDMELYMEYY